MNEKEPLLSICIPTYNREKYLKRLLDSIVCQKEFTDTDEVEIVVDDGPSSDNTESIVKDYIKKYWDKIKYYRNQAIWMCPAFLESLNYWRWKYLRLMWSDDLMSKISLWIVLRKIKTSLPKLILSKWCYYKDLDKESKEVIMKDFNGFQDFSTYIGINYSWTWREISLDREAFFTFISVFCINKDYYLFAYKTLVENHISKERLSQHYFNFSFISFSQLYVTDTISVIEMPKLVWMSWNQPSWTSCRKIANDLKLEFKYLENNYTISYCAKKALKKLLHPWIMAGYLAPIKKIIKFCWLFGVYCKLSEKYRKMCGYS